MTRLPRPVEDAAIQLASARLRNDAKAEVFHRARLDRLIAFARGSVIDGQCQEVTT